MNEQYWIEWCQQQLAEVSSALLTQGYTASRIENLNRAVPEFHAAFTAFQTEAQDIINQMVTQPESYEHYESFAGARKRFLTFTGLHRERFLDSTLLRTA